MLAHLKFILFYPKISSDMYLTHWLLYLKPTRLWFQKRKVYRIGYNSEIRPFATLNGTSSINIGNNVIIPPGSTLSAPVDQPEKGIVIEDDVLIGPNVSIYSSSHNFKDISIPIKQQGYFSKKVVIKRGSWLGVNSVIMPGVTIGRNSVVAAGAIVTKDVPDYSVVAGVPAQLIKNLEN